MAHIIIGITGASGSVLAKRMLEHLCHLDIELSVVITENGEAVFAYEAGVGWPRFVEAISGQEAAVTVWNNQDLFSSIASGSYPADAMIIIPCSMATVGKIATGTGSNLLCRAADVCLKEGRRLVLVPRETPLHQIHLENLLTLSRCGGVIVPPTPMFYQKPESLDDLMSGIVGRVLKSAGLDNTLYKTWRKPQ